MPGGVWEKFRSVLCISGGTRHATQTPSPRGDAAAGDVSGRGSEGKEDLLSALPDDVLLLVLHRLPSAAAAARTSVLSRRWPGLWTHLPRLRFPDPADPLDRVRAVLADNKAPALRLLHVVTSGADPGDTAAVLRLAAQRLTGKLFFHNEALEEDRARDGAAVDLPSFEEAERIYLRLGYLALALPLSGVFAKLTILRLDRVRFHGLGNLGDAFSSARCPSLQELRVYNALGVSNLAIRSESLLILALHHLEGMQQLTIVSPILRELDITNCFGERKPVADISTPVLEMLGWYDAYDSSLVQLHDLSRLQELRTFGVVGSGYFDFTYNWNSVMLFQQFQKIPKLELYIAYRRIMVDPWYLTEVMTLLPDVENLHMILSTEGHFFGPCMFHFLRLSPNIRKLKLTLCGNNKGHNACSRCLCHQPQDWETVVFFLNSLQDVEIHRSTGAEHELEFLKRLLRWALVLKTITITFDPSVSITEEVCQELLGLSRQEIVMKIYLNRDGAKVLYAPVA